MMTRHDASSTSIATVDVALNLDGRRLSTTTTLDDDDDDEATTTRTTTRTTTDDGRQSDATDGFGHSS